MKRKSKPPDLPGSLRSEAEARAAFERPPPLSALRSAEELLAELGVYQIELEIQNEQLRITQAALEESRDQYLDLYEFAPVGYLTLTSGGQIVQLNFAAAALLGRPRKELLMHRFERFVAPAQRERWQRLFIALKKTGDKLTEELEIQPRGGAAFHAEVYGQRKTPRETLSDEKTPIVRLVLIDLSTSIAAGEKRRAAAIVGDDREHLPGGGNSDAWQALTDPLTHLPNRRLMMDRLHHAISALSRTRKYCALMFIDLDKFKSINDTLGHDAGDQLLCHASQRLLACVREGDTVARLGGDEFVVILENLHGDVEEAAVQARRIGEKICVALNQPCSLAGQNYAGSASIGVTLFIDPHDCAEVLLKRADMAMYEAKTAGRNALRFFDHGMQQAVAARTNLEADLRRALAADELQCHFQPQIDGDGRISGAEVLLRWMHPQRGLMSPDEFIGVAEDTGLSVAIGQWVLETACARLKTWESGPSGRCLHLAVNIGSREFEQPGIVASLRAVLERSGIAPADLTLEFKEKTVLADRAQSRAKMAAFKQLGVRLAIDDFGIGCSSLSQLSELPLDQLKIDRSIVHDIGVNPRDQAIVQSLIDVTRLLGMEVIAEGVETEAQHAFLEQHGCHVFQGYLFGAPMPGGDFARLLTTH